MEATEKDKVKRHTLGTERRRICSLLFHLSDLDVGRKRERRKPRRKVREKEGEGEEDNKEKELKSTTI